MKKLAAWHRPWEVDELTIRQVELEEEKESLVEEAEQILGEPDSECLGSETDRPDDGEVVEEHCDYDNGLDSGTYFLWLEDFGL